MLPTSPWSAAGGGRRGPEGPGAAQPGGQPASRAAHQPRPGHAATAHRPRPAPAEVAARPCSRPFRSAARQLPAGGGRAPPNDLLRLRSASGGGVWMEASAPGRARRGRRRARAAGSPLSRAAVVLLLSAFAARAPPSGEAPPPGLRGAAAPRWGFWVTCPRRRGSVYRKPRAHLPVSGEQVAAEADDARSEERKSPRGSVSERSRLSAISPGLVRRPYATCGARSWSVFPSERVPPVCHCPRCSGFLCWFYL